MRPRPICSQLHKVTTSLQCRQSLSRPWMKSKLSVNAKRAPKLERGLNNGRSECTMSRTAAAGAIAVAMALVGCAHSVRKEPLGNEAGHSADYYPLAVGNRWVYVGRFLGQPASRDVKIIRADQGYFI